MVIASKEATHFLHASKQGNMFPTRDMRLRLATQN